MQREVEAFTFGFFADAQPDHQVDNLEDDQGDNDVVHEHDRHADDLIEHLVGIAFDQAGRAAVGGHGEHAGQDGAGGAADRVDAKRIERIVIAEEVLEPSDAPIADDAGGDADGRGRPPGRQSPKPA